jgi:hypothetical protein
MGSKDLVVERRIGLLQSEQELEEWGFQDKEYNGHRQAKVDVEDTPRNKLPVLKAWLKAWLMFKEQDPSNDRHYNRLKARKGAYAEIRTR